MRLEAATLPVEEAAEILGLSRASAYRAAGTGEIPTIRIGRRLLVLREPLERMLRGESRAPSPTDASPNAAA